MPFAEGTTVPVERSRAEIETLLRRYGADQFVSGWDAGMAMIGFHARERTVRFILPIPSRTEKRFTHATRRLTGRLTREYPRTPEDALRQWEGECRRRWRSLALTIKAKLEAVETGIALFEQEFLANILMPDGRTVGEHVTPMIARAYTTGETPKLLPEFAGDAKGAP